MKEIRLKETFDTFTELYLYLNKVEQIHGHSNTYQYEISISSSFSISLYLCLRKGNPQNLPIT